MAPTTALPKCLVDHQYRLPSLTTVVVPEGVDSKTLFGNKKEKVLS